jgi:hypothetical protein
MGRKRGKGRAERREKGERGMVKAKEEMGKDKRKEN